MQKVPEIIKNLSSDKVVAKYGEDYVLISTAYPNADWGVPEVMETLAFICDEDGKVLSWHEVAGGPYMTIADVLSEISRFGIRKG
jgi:thiamine monophosphate kinase